MKQLLFAFALMWVTVISSDPNEVYSPIVYHYPTSTTSTCHQCSSELNGIWCGFFCCFWAPPVVEKCMACAIQVWTDETGFHKTYVRQCLSASIPAVPGCRRDETGNRISCICVGNNCNGNDWKSFHTQSKQDTESPASRGTWWNFRPKESGSQASNYQDRRVDKAQKNIENRSQKKSLFARVFWWWSRD